MTQKSRLGKVTEVLLGCFLSIPEGEKVHGLSLPLEG